MGACWDFYLFSSLLDIRSLGLGQRGGQSGLGALPFVPMGEQGLPKPGWQTRSHKGLPHRGLGPFCSPYCG